MTIWTSFERFNETQVYRWREAFYNTLTESVTSARKIMNTHCVDCLEHVFKCKTMQWFPTLFTWNADVALILWQMYSNHFCKIAPWKITNLDPKSIILRFLHSLSTRCSANYHRVEHGTVNCVTQTPYLDPRKRRTRWNFGNIRIVTDVVMTHLFQGMTSLKPTSYMCPTTIVRTTCMAKSMDWESCHCARLSLSRRGWNLDLLTSCQIDPNGDTGYPRRMRHYLSRLKFARFSIATSLDAPISSWISRRDILSEVSIHLSEKSTDINSTPRRKLAPTLLENKEKYMSAIHANLAFLPGKRT